MGHGGARPGSGRKTKAEEMGLPLLIEECIGEDGKRALINSIKKQALKGSFMHQQLLMQYIYGKPTDHIDHTSKGEAITVKFTDAF